MHGPTTLNIIGNGFDLWHGLPTEFADFRTYLSRHHHPVAEAVETYLPIRDDWKDLESSFAELDPAQLQDDFGHFAASYGADDWSDSAHHDYQYEVGELVQKLSNQVRAAFSSWVRSIDVRRAKPYRLSLSPAARYLTFNYTATLQTLYGVPPSRICHLHGFAGLSEDELVLGHAWQPSARRSLNDRPDIRSLDTREVEANGIIDRYFEATFKPAQRIIERHSGFFDSMGDITDVVVYGHSAHAVDALYYDALLQHRAVRQARWVLPSIDDDDFRSREERLLRYGVPKVDCVRWDELSVHEGA